MDKDTKSNIKVILFYVMAVMLGAAAGIWGNDFIIGFTDIISKIFIRLFKFIAVPIIASSVICTLVSADENKKNKKIWKHTIFYTLSTTAAAASLACILFKVYSPAGISAAEDTGIAETVASKGSYIDNFISIVPDNFFGAFLSGNVLSVLITAFIIGAAIPKISNQEAKKTIINFIAAIQDILFTAVKWLIAVLPIAVFGFTAGCFKEFQTGTDLGGLGSYFAAVITSNLIQMFIVLPAFLLSKKLNPIKVFAGTGKALTVAFFSKSSAATLPVTIQCAENNNNVKPEVSRFVLPICTTINMNGCAAFIVITILYLMKNAGMQITFADCLIWICVSIIAAVGNAGVPMGCFFLAASLASSMNLPILIMGIILPFFNIIDMLETSLNVWSDSCVANMVNKDIEADL